MTSQDDTLGSPFLFTTKEEKDNLALPEGSQHYPHFYQMDAYSMMPPEYSYHYDPYAIPYQYHHSTDHMLQQPSEPELPKEEDWITCPHEECGKQFKKQSTLHAHLRTHTNVAKPFLCRICNFSFSRSHGACD
jgi:hypothetical protein